MEAPIKLRELAHKIQNVSFYSTESLTIDAIFFGIQLVQKNYQGKETILELISRINSDLLKNGDDDFIERKLEVIQKLIFQKDTPVSIRIQEEIPSQIRTQVSVQTQPSTNQQNNLVKEFQATCQICEEEYKHGDIFPLSDCEHIYHESCLRQYVKTKLKSAELNFLCPECSKAFSQNDIKDLLGVNYEQYESLVFQKYIEKQNPKDFQHCLTPDCKFAFDNKIDQLKQFDCPECRKSYCLTCKTKFTKGHNCEEFKQAQSQNQNGQPNSDVLFEQLVKQVGIKQCFNCSRYVEKKDGCDHITCICGFQFCYRCGGPYPCLKIDCKEIEMRSFTRLMQSTTPNFFLQRQQASHHFGINLDSLDQQQFGNFLNRTSLFGTVNPTYVNQTQNLFHTPHQYQQQQQQFQQPRQGLFQAPPQGMRQQRQQQQQTLFDEDDDQFFDVRNSPFAHTYVNY